MSGIIPSFQEPVPPRTISRVEAIAKGGFYLVHGHGCDLEMARYESLPKYAFDAFAEQKTVVSRIGQDAVVGFSSPDSLLALFVGGTAQSWNEKKLVADMKLMPGCSLEEIAVAKGNFVALRVRGVSPNSPELQLHYYP